MRKSTLREKLNFIFGHVLDSINKIFIFGGIQFTSLYSMKI